MKYILTSIRDSKTGYSQINQAVNDETAIRDFVSVFNRVDGIFKTHYADFTLMKVGVFDAVTGSVVACDPVELIDGITAHNYFNEV